MRNLPFTGKSAEREVVQQFFDQYTASALLPENQSSYHRGYTTETALFKVHNDNVMNISTKEIEPF